MSLRELHERAPRRLHNLLTLRETLSDMIVLEISRSPVGRGYSYEACLQWLNWTTIDREYMGVAMSTWRNHWLAQECRVETTRKAEDKSAQRRSLGRQYLRSAFKT